MKKTFFFIVAVEMKRKKCQQLWREASADYKCDDEMEYYFSQSVDLSMGKGSSSS
jgi:hypothetical protein